MTKLDRCALAGASTTTLGLVAVAPTRTYLLDLIVTVAQMIWYLAVFDFHLLF